MKRYLSVGVFLLLATFPITAAADEGAYQFPENVLIARADDAEACADEAETLISFCRNAACKFAFAASSDNAALA